MANVNLKSAQKQTIKITPINGFSKLKTQQQQRQPKKKTEEVFMCFGLFFCDFISFYFAITFNSPCLLHVQKKNNKPNE